MPFKFTKLDINDVILVEPQIFDDKRGSFMETYKKSDFINNGILDEFVQDNHSVSAKGVLRGIHFQKAPYPQAKLVRCIKGKIFDVAVDLRRDSKTFKKWIGVELSAENKKQLYIPAGFGHAFYSYEDDTHIIYKVSEEFKAEYDSGFAWNDDEINIKWAFEGRPLISKKDMQLPGFDIREVF